MNTHKIGIIIGREYMNRVKKKSFLLITFLVPILFVVISIVPALIMTVTKEPFKKVAVVDASGIVMPMLKDTETIGYSDCRGESVDSLKPRLAELGYDAVLSISPLDTVGKTVSAEIYSMKPLGVDMSSNINNVIDSAVEDYRISQYGIDDLETIMAAIKSDVRLRSYTIGEGGEDKVSESGVYMGVSLVLGMVIYMFITMFSGMVMSSVIEEKSSRVVEVLISSVKSTELMFGKIIGIALVAFTQFLMWIVLTLAILGVVSAVAGPKLFSGDPVEMVQMAGMDASQAEAVSAMASGDSEVAAVFSSIANMPIVTILVSFILFFLFGYMLYASLFAAIGSAVENEGDSAQLQLPLTIPLMLAFFIALYAFKAPDSSLVFWTSLFPLTSPIVMLARIPFGVPTWELVLSIVLLVLTFAVCAWASAKIYRVGILSFGKKSTFKDLWKWLKQK